MSSEHVGNLADQFGASAALIQRSAQARATASGTSIEDILTAWTGGAPAPKAAPAPVDRVPEESAPVIPDEPATSVEAARPEPGGAEAPEPSTEVAAGLMPATPVAGAARATTTSASGFSSWMVAAFFVIPLFGLLYLVINSNGVACGEGGRLEVAFDGSLVNCDGTSFEGRGGGGAQAMAFLTVGQEVYSTGARCASCHGANGQGGTGPAFAGGAILTTFPSCEDHVTWISLGSNGWSVEVGSTYGTQTKPVEGGMPSFAADLSDEQLRSVAAFERIRFGGAPAEETLIACGLITEEEPAEGEPASEGQEP
jgi:mono/diheme cytochrome c family protein